MQQWNNRKEVETVTNYYIISNSCRIVEKTIKNSVRNGGNEKCYDI